MNVFSPCFGLKINFIKTIFPYKSTDLNKNLCIDLYSSTTLTKLQATKSYIILNVIFACAQLTKSTTT